MDPLLLFKERDTVEFIQQTIKTRAIVVVITIRELFLPINACNQIDWCTLLLIKYRSLNSVQYIEKLWVWLMRFRITK